MGAWLPDRNDRATLISYQNEHLRKLPCKRVQVDETWSFCGLKEKNVPPMRKGEFGKGDV